MKYKYKYKYNLSQPLNLKQLFNQMIKRKISIHGFTLMAIKLLLTKSKVSIPKFFIAETKTIYSSLSIGTMIMIILSYHYDYAINYPYTTYFVSIFIAYAYVKIYLQLNIWGGRKSNYLEIWIPLYLLFLSYAITVQSYSVKRYITIIYGVLPETFNKVINYISRMVAIQDSLVVVLFPLVLLLIINSRKVFNNSKFKVFWIACVSYLAIIFIFVAVLSKRNTAFFKPYQYWVEKHSFVDTVLCEEKSYSENVIYGHFKARKLSNQNYLILSKSGKNNNDYNYYELSCKQFNSLKIVFNYGFRSLTNKVSNMKEPIANLLSKILHYSANLINIKLYYLLQTHNLTFSSFHSKIE
jgi:hypothetical protein